MKIALPINKEKMREKIRALTVPLDRAIGKVLEAMAKLSPRERMIVTGGAVFVVVFTLLVGIIWPLAHSRSSLEKSIELKDAQLRKIYTMGATIRGLQAAGKTDLKERQFTLFGYLEQLATQLSVNDRIDYMKPVTDSTEQGRESVEVRLKGLYQEDIIGLLFGIENTPYPVKIKRMNLKKSDKDANFDVTLQVVSYG